MKVTATVTIALACLCIVPSAADPLPDAKALRDLADAAAGPLPQSYRDTLAISGTRGPGSVTLYVRGNDRRAVSDFGPLHSETGTRGGESWHENANGHVIVEEPDPGNAVADRLTTSVSRLRTPVDAFVVSELNVRGFGTRDFYDPVTHDLVRRERLTANGKDTTAYSDFQSVAGRHLPTRWTEHDETTNTDTLTLRTDFRAGDVTDDDVAMPVQTRTLVEYPAGVDRVVLPSAFEPSGHVIVRVTIDGRGLDFILDTGASGITLDPGVAARLGLTVVARRDSSSNAGRFATESARVPLMSVGALTMRDTFVAIVPLAAYEVDTKSVGLLGFDFLCESGITIDYERQSVTAERFGTYAAPASPRTIALPTRLGSQVPMTTLNVDGAVAERILIDTGAVGPFMLFDYFQRRYPKVMQQSSLRQTAFQGVGGPFIANPIKLGSVRLGSITFKDFTGFAVATRSAYSSDADGVIGPDFLHYFDVHLDYPNGMVYLVLNARADRSK